jgi:nucleoside-diphosphate-sugar epimerase
MRTILVTGGAGFIGSHLVDALLSEGIFRVRVLDDLSTGSLANLAHCRGQIEFIRGDVRDLETCLLACEGVEVVFHEAALPSVPRSIEDPLTSNEVNVTGTLQMLIAARDRGVRRLVFASSSSVYGNTEISPKHEDLAPNPLSPYAVQKATGEQYARTFASVYGLETVALRYFNVFGPRQRPESAYAAVVPRFARAALCGQPVTIHGDGDQSRDFTHVANVVRANLLAASAPDAVGRAFNVGCGAAHTLRDLCRGIESITGRRLEVQHGPPREGDVRASLADLTRARAALRYEPAVPFEEGLRSMVRWVEREFAPRTESLRTASIR